MYATAKRVMDATRKRAKRRKFQMLYRYNPATGKRLGVVQRALDNSSGFAVSNNLGHPAPERTGQ